MPRLQFDQGPLARWCLSVLVASFVLMLGEVIWLPAQPASAAYALLFGSTLATVALIQALGVLIARAIAAAARHWQWLILTILWLGPATWASWSLLSGERISTLPAILLIKVAVALLLAAAGLTSVLVLGWLGRGSVDLPRRALGLVMVFGTLALAFVDHHLLVGLYPALHYLLAAGSLFAASAAGLVAARLRKPPAAIVTRASLALILIGILGVVFSWKSRSAMNLAADSDGLFAKTRSAVAFALSALPRDKPNLPQQSWQLQDFAFRPTHGEQMDAVRAKTKNVVFVLTDAFRNDYVGAEHEGRPLMPFWNEWQKESIRFESAYAPSDQTAKSMAPLFTSYPVGVIDHAAEAELPLRTWLNLLADSDFRTYANGLCDYLYRKHADILIDECMGAEQFAPGRNRTDRAIDEIRDFIAKDPGEPFAIYTHWLDVHIHKGQTVGDYRRQVTAIDRRMRLLVELLKELQVYDETLLIWTADHGYGVGEGGKLFGKHGVVEYMLRVPLVMHIPGLVPEREGYPRRVNQNVSGLSVAPTLLDILAPETQMLVGAQSLMGMLIDPADPRLEDTQSVVASTTDQRALRRGRYKLLVREAQASVQLFDLKKDPLEKQPLDDPTIERDLQQRLQIELGRQAKLAELLNAENGTNALLAP